MKVVESPFFDVVHGDCIHSKLQVIVAASAIKLTGLTGQMFVSIRLANDRVSPS